MAEKRGKGGYGSENYDPKTGQYIKEGENVFHAGVGQSVEDLLADLKSGVYDEPELENEEGLYSKLFENDKDDELEEDEELWEQKNYVVSQLQSLLDDYNTQQLIMDKDYPEITQNEFREYGQECVQNTSLRDRAAFEDGYKGAGGTCFEFNKALRFGFQRFYEVYPQFRNSPSLNERAIIDRANKLDNLTNSWEFPENKKVIRFVDTAPLISWFGQSGIFDDIKKEVNQYNLEVFKDGYDKKDIAKRLQSLVGTKVPPDGSFTSFSCMSDASHMAKNLSDNKRFILIRYNVRKGTKAWVSQYEYESEGLFNRNTGFFIQGADLETIIDPRTGRKYEVVVLDYGIQ